MPATFITTDDLREFKFELIQELAEILEHKISKTGLPKRWLKAKEVQSILGISPNTLIMLRATGKLPFTKIKGTLYFEWNDIVKMMEPKK